MNSDNAKLCSSPGSSSGINGISVGGHYSHPSVFRQGDGNSRTTLQRPASFALSQMRSGRPWPCGAWSNKFEYPSSWLHTGHSSSTDCSNVDEAVYLATKWLSKWTEPRNYNGFLADVSWSPGCVPFTVVLHADKATTAENTRIPLKIS